MVEWSEANERLLLLALLKRDHQGNWDNIVRVMRGDFTTHGVRYVLAYATGSFQHEPILETTFFEL